MKKIRKEKNVDVFNQDVKKLGGYEYTEKQDYSTVTAGKRQSKEILDTIKKQQKKPKTMLDVGSGDGTYTFELLKKLKPQRIIGFDFSKAGVETAKKKIKNKDLSRINFLQSSIYDIDRIIKDKFDIAVIRGVLHHLYQPERGINAICKLTNTILVVEPNGYSPILKIIEKVSPYHRRHEEKSYWPPTLDNWFIKNGFRVKEQYFFGVVPFFFPEKLSRILKSIEPVMEKIPYLNRMYCASNLIVYER